MQFPHINYFKVQGKRWSYDNIVDISVEFFISKLNIVLRKVVLK